MIPWNLKNEARAFFAAFVEPDLTTQQLDDGLTDREPQALQLLIVAHLEEGVKHVFSVFWWNALTRIRHADAHVILIFGTGHGDNAFVCKLYGI